MKKITIFLSALLIFTFFFVGSSYAATDFSDYADVSLPVFDPSYTASKSDIVLYQTSNGVIFLSHFYTIEEPETYNLKVEFGVPSGSSNYAFTVTNLSTTDIVIRKDYQFNESQFQWVEYFYKTLEPNKPSEGDIGSPSKGAKFFYSTVDILDFNGNLVFQKTLPQTPTQNLTVEEMIAQETPVMAEKITQAMGQILIIAVGSLALLISLVVFYKVFWIYRVR